MKNTLLLLSVLAASNAMAALAQNTQSDSTNNATTFTSMPWDTSPAHWEKVLQEPRNLPELHLGKSEFVVSGPLVDGFRGKRHSSDASLGQKFLALPIVNLIVPQRMSSPPTTGGRYFAWRDSNRSWSELAAGSVGGNSSNPAYNEPSGTLISLRLGGH